MSRKDYFLEVHIQRRTNFMRIAIERLRHQTAIIFSFTFSWNKKAWKVSVLSADYMPLELWANITQLIVRNLNDVKKIARPWISRQQTKNYELKVALSYKLDYFTSICCHLY